MRELEIAGTITRPCKVCGASVKKRKVFRRLAEFGQTHEQVEKVLLKQVRDWKMENKDPVHPKCQS